MYVCVCVWGGGEGVDVIGQECVGNDILILCLQTDVFEVEAVSLMSVDKVLIGHHSASAGVC